MRDNIRILFLSANPWTTSRILVDEEAREIFERLQEGPYRHRFELHNHAATRPIDLQRLLLLYEPQIVHFSGHGTKRQKLILGGVAGRGKTVDTCGLADLFALYKSHLRLVLLNACFTKLQARSIANVIDYAVGTGKGIGDKAGVSFAGAFYRALGFGKSIRAAFESAKAELALTKMPRTQGIELFARNGISEMDPFSMPGCLQPDPEISTPSVGLERASDFDDGSLLNSSGNTRLVLKKLEQKSETQVTVLNDDGTMRCERVVRYETRIYVPAEHDVVIDW